MSTSSRRCAGSAVTGTRSGTPLTRRIEGVLDISALADTASPLLPPLIARAVHDIEQRLLDRTRFFTDGEWVDPLGSETHHALEAATGEPLGTASLGTDADIDRAVKAARRALDQGPWGRTTAAERAAYMHKFAAALTACAEGTSKLVSQENGSPVRA